MNNSHGLYFVFCISYGFSYVFRMYFVLFRMFFVFCRVKNPDVTLGTDGINQGFMDGKHQPTCYFARLSSQTHDDLSGFWQVDWANDSLQRTIGKEELWTGA